jgi:hypothetical protein
MKSQSCERYLSDPEANATHLDECAECAALFASPELPFDYEPVAVEAMPLAPWEGASHRPWALVIGGALALLTIASGLFASAGVAPLSGIAAALRSGVPPLGVVKLLLQQVGTAAQQAPAAWQIAVAVLFVAVNTLLWFLLRRAPKGIDVDA